MNKLFSLIVGLLLLLIPVTLDAQCAMCKAVVESNSQDANNIVGSVNDGILYLMGVPYFILLVIGFAWYKKFGKRQET